MKHTYAHGGGGGGGGGRLPKTREWKSDGSHMEVCRREVDLPLLKKWDIERPFNVDVVNI